MKNKNSNYLLLSAILVILSIIAGIFLFNILRQRHRLASQPLTSQKIALIPTDSPQQLIDDLSDDDIFKQPSPTNKPSPTKIITQVPTKIPIPTLVPTSTPDPIKIFTDINKTFALEYDSSRIIYEDNTATTSKRYTFYLATSSFALHISPTGTWSWSHPNRQFTNTFTVDGQPTFKYDIDTQTIVDLQSTGKNYTLQCIHNGKEALKTECDQFIKSFKLL
jgi:hypothetical protein